MKPADIVGLSTERKESANPSDDYILEVNKNGESYRAGENL